MRSPRRGGSLRAAERCAGRSSRAGACRSRRSRRARNRRSPVDDPEGQRCGAGPEERASGPIGDRDRPPIGERPPGIEGHEYPEQEYDLLVTENDDAERRRAAQRRPREDGRASASLAQSQKVTATPNAAQSFAGRPKMAAVASTCPEAANDEPETDALSDREFRIDRAQPGGDEGSCSRHEKESRTLRNPRGRFQPFRVMISLVSISSSRKLIGRFRQKQSSSAQTSKTLVSSERSPSPLIDRRTAGGASSRCEEAAESSPCPERRPRKRLRRPPTREAVRVSRSRRARGPICYPRRATSTSTKLPNSGDRRISARSTLLAIPKRAPGRRHHLLRPPVSQYLNGV